MRGRGRRRKTACKWMRWEIETGTWRWRRRRSKRVVTGCRRRWRRSHHRSLKEKRREEKERKKEFVNCEEYIHTLTYMTKILLTPRKSLARLRVGCHSIVSLTETPPHLSMIYVCVHIHVCMYVYACMYVCMYVCNLQKRLRFHPILHV